MRATASSMPWVGRQSVRARIRMPEVLGGLDGGADLHARLLARQAGLAGRGQRTRRDLVLDQHGGGAGAAIGAHGALHVHGVAVAVVAVGQHQQVGRRAMHHLEGVEHLAEGQQVEVGAAQATGRDAGTGEEGRLEAGAGAELGGEPVIDRRHDDEAGLGQHGAQAGRSGGSGHDRNPPEFSVRTISDGGAAMKMSWRPRTAWRSLAGTGRPQVTCTSSPWRSATKWRDRRRCIAGPGSCRGKCRIASNRSGSRRGRTSSGRRPD